MTHLGFVATAYALAVALPVGFGLAAWQRMKTAQMRLAAIDPRNRTGA